MSPEEMNIWISGMSKEDLYQCQWASSNPLSRQRKRRTNLLFEPRYPYSLALVQSTTAPGSEAFDWDTDQSYTTGPRFLGLQTLSYTINYTNPGSPACRWKADCGTSKPPYPSELIPTINHFLFISIYPTLKNTEWYAIWSKYWMMSSFQVLGKFQHIYISCSDYWVNILLLIDAVPHSRKLHERWPERGDDVLIEHQWHLWCNWNSLV